MPRLIELRSAERLPESLTIRVGDLLMFGASGGHLRSGGEVLELIGPFVPAVLGDNGQILSPAAAPNAVFFLARSVGIAPIDVFEGDPWHGPKINRLTITVEA
jgi:hypothetical protein